MADIFDEVSEDLKDQYKQIWLNIKRSLSLLFAFYFICWVFKYVEHYQEKRN